MAVDCQGKDDLRGSQREVQAQQILWPLSLSQQRRLRQGPSFLEGEYNEKDQGPTRSRVRSLGWAKPMGLALELATQTEAGLGQATPRGAGLEQATPERKTLEGAWSVAGPEWSEGERGPTRQCDSPLRRPLWMAPGLACGWPGVNNSPGTQPLRHLRCLSRMHPARRCERTAHLKSPMDLRTEWFPLPAFLWAQY